MPTKPNSSTEAPLRAGIVVGSIGAIASSLANLPLEAPTDTLFNAATVSAGSLLAGLVAGLLWRALASCPRRPTLFAVTLVITFIIVAAAATTADSQVDRVKSYIVPLAAINLFIIGLLTPLASRKLRSTPIWLAPTLLIAALIIGGALAGQGDARSGTLKLPPRSIPIVHQS